jgi:hypothetical protein
MSKDRLFVPLNKQWYDLFLSGAKKWEIRGVRPGFNTKTIWVGRKVELRRGYAVKGALWGIITDVILTRHVYDVPKEVMKEMIPVPLSDTKTWNEIDKYNSKYGEFIVFKILMGDPLSSLPSPMQKHVLESMSRNKEAFERLAKL